jgi:DNA-binding PucR family transcriptional regulator
VAYRLRRAEELLGRPIAERQPELRASIMLACALKAVNS